MGEETGSTPALVLVGTNHRSASVALRDKLSVEEAEFGDVLSRLRAAGIGQALLLSTCDRVEVHAVAEDTGAAARAVTRVLAERAGIDAAEAAGGLYTLEGAEALRHLFAVAASLDSLVIGEPQVLGQVKASHRMAEAAGMIGGALERHLQAAYAAAKRVRSETAIGERPVSIAAAAVDVAREILGDLGERSGLVVGVGEMGELVARQLQGAGLARLVVSHRSAARAEALARRLGANVQPFEALAEVLAAADVVVSCVGLGAYVVTPELMREALRRRRYRPLFVVDLAVPRDADPAVNDLDGAFVYDTGDLEGVAQAGLAEREAAAAAAWRLIDEELAAYSRACSMRAAAPSVVALRDHFEAVREGVLEEVDPGDAAAATRLLVNRLLHDPSEALREIAAAGDGGAERGAAEQFLRRLFRLAAGGRAPTEGPKE
ncbi:MAG: glutamyl-tRNA reductase [Alphaproteobacteria bacterium]